MMLRSIFLAGATALSPAFAIPAFAEPVTSEAKTA